MWSLNNFPLITVLNDIQFFDILWTETALKVESMGVKRTNEVQLKRLEKDLKDLKS
jgi:hypothetical protein